MDQLKQRKFIVKCFEDDNHLITHWLNRVLFVLSFKEADIQRLDTITKILRIDSEEQRKEYSRELMRLVQRGIVYFPKGFPKFLEICQELKNNKTESLDSIELCLLHPYQRLIKNLQAEFPTHTMKEFSIVVEV